MLRRGSYRILCLINSNPGICRQDLAVLYGAKHQSASIVGSLTELCGKGFISHNRRTMGQRMQYSVTAKGMAAISLIEQLEALE